MVKIIRKFVQKWYISLLKTFRLFNPIYFGFEYNILMKISLKHLHSLSYLVKKSTFVEIH